MLFAKRFWAGIEDGSVTVAVRRWKRPTVKAGGSLQSKGGLLAIDAVDVIDLADLTPDDVRAAGYDDRAQLEAELRPEGTLYRIRFHRQGDDPRQALRQQADLDDAAYESLAKRLDRLPWAPLALELIARHPGTVSTELAPHLDMERYRFKDHVRRLKALGLTESLPVGYRLSPRGEALLTRLAADPTRTTRP